MEYEKSYIVHAHMRVIRWGASFRIPLPSNLLLPAARSLPVEVMRREQSEPQQTAATLTPSCPTESGGGRVTLCGVE